MAENSHIEWCHHTFNPWEGCTKVGPGCDNCYAEARNNRFHGGNWGPGAPRRLTSEANWKKPLKWNREAAEKGVRYRVFCASLADVFDNEVPHQWRHDLFALIQQTPNLDWLLLTKRIGNVPKLVDTGLFEELPNIWLGATIVNQTEADRDIPKLLSVPARVRFLSMEPLLERVDLFNHFYRPVTNEDIVGDPRPIGNEYRLKDDRPSWVIVGGESGPGARPMHPEWARSLRGQCEEADVPFLFKQWGEWAPGDSSDDDLSDVDLGEFHAGSIWVLGCMCEEGDGPLFRVGKKRAGRTLDGRTWDEYPLGQQ